MHFVGDGVVEETFHVATDELDGRAACDFAAIRLPKSAVQLPPRFRQFLSGTVSDDLASGVSS